MSGVNNINLEEEYGYFLEKLVEFLDEDVVEHHGVKGMKWGVRKERDPAKEIHGLGPDKIEVKTKNGETLSLTKDRPNRLVRFIARHHDKYREDANNFASLTIRNSNGKSVGEAQLTKVSKDEINLVWLGIDGNQRGKGYATATFKAAVEFGKQAGVEKLTLEVPGNAPDARHIYEKQGFKSKGKVSDPDDIWGGLEKMELNFDDVRHSTMLHLEKPPLDDDLLMHFGIKGMRWGHRKADHPEVSRRTNKEASKDAQEFARAKMFYGEGAGTRRKLIKAKVETKARHDPNYKKAFDHHLGQQNLGKHAEKARSERRRKDTKTNVRKTGNAINRAINGPFAGSAAIALVGVGAAYAKQNGLDQKAATAARNFASNRKLQQEVRDLLRNT